MLYVKANITTALAAYYATTKLVCIGDEVKMQT